MQTLEAQFKSLTDTCIAYANEAAQLRAHAARYALGLDLEACDSLDCMCVRRRYESLLNTKFEETRALALDDRRRIDEATRKADTKFGQYDQQVMPYPAPPAALSLGPVGRTFPPCGPLILHYRTCSPYRASPSRRSPSCRRPAVAHLARRQVGELSTRTARSEARAGDAEINASEARAFAGGVDSRLNELRLETTQAARELWAYVDDWKIWKTAQEQV